MSTGRSRDDLLKFIDYLSSKGLIPGATASARKASANKVLSILGEEEAADILALDLDMVMHRFSNLNGQQYTPQSLNDYRSRLRSSVEDFRSYVENPLGFKPAGRSRTKAADGRASATPKKISRAENSRPAIESEPSRPMPAATVHILPIPLRADLVVQVAGLPFDLSAAEAKKIANIILAHAISE